MRNSSCAKRPASSPPAPARTSRITLRSSFGSFGRSRIFSFSWRSPPRFSGSGRSAFASSRSSGSSSATRVSSSSLRARWYSRNASTSGSSCARSFAICEKRGRSPMTSGLLRSAVRRSNLCSISCSLSSTNSPALGLRPSRAKPAPPRSAGRGPYPRQARKATRTFRRRQGAAAALRGNRLGGKTRPFAAGGAWSMREQQYGKYLLLDRIAVGGMAEIFLARQMGPEGFEKTVVLKRIRPHLGDKKSFVRMFLNEAKLAAQLNHPNIIHIHDLGKVGDSYFIAMEYLFGRDMRRVLPKCEQQGIAFPVVYACKIASQVLEGLFYAHQKSDLQGRPLGIVHRDVTPENIFVSFDGGVKVLDFGIA